MGYSDKAHISEFSDAELEIREAAFSKNMPVGNWRFCSNDNMEYKKVYQDAAEKQQVKVLITDDAYDFCGHPIPGYIRILVDKDEPDDKVDLYGYEVQSILHEPEADHDYHIERQKERKKQQDSSV
jgi:hypothetical protein